MAMSVRPADDAYRARHRRASSADAELALADLRVDDVASASLAALPDDLWRRICAFARPATCARSLVVAAGRSESLQHALRAEVAQTEKRLFGMTRREGLQIVVNDRERYFSLAYPNEELPKVSGLGESFHFALSCAPDLATVDADAPLRLAQAFLACGVDPDYQGESVFGEYGGKTALMLLPDLAMEGYDAEPLALLLIKCGADIHATCYDGCSPLAYSFVSLRWTLSRWGSSFGPPVERRLVSCCVSMVFLLLSESLAATCRSLRAHRRLHRDPEATFEVVRASIRKQENNYMWRQGGSFPQNLRRFCEVTELFVSFLRTGGDEFDSNVLELHCWMRVLMEVGLDHEALPEFLPQPDGIEPDFVDFKQVTMMPLVQARIRERLRKLVE